MEKNDFPYALQANMSKIGMEVWLTGTLQTVYENITEGVWITKTHLSPFLPFFVCLVPR